MGERNANTLTNESQKVLEMLGIDKRFQGVHALKECTFELRKGEVHALVGENGAGKSTLMKILTGIYQPDKGEIVYNGKKVHFRTAKEAQVAGISIVHQELNLMNHLTAAQNIFVGREAKGFMTDDRVINERTRKLFDSLNLNIKPTDKISFLTIGKAQMVEIAKAISFEANILVLDEPTAALTISETEELFNMMNELRAKGVSIIYISHRLEEIEVMADRVTVMRDGQYVGTLVMKDATLDQIIKMMVGRTIYEEPKTKSHVKPDAPVVLETKNLSSPLVKDVSFLLRQGEILGFAGLIGAGRTEVARLVIGADRRFRGDIFVSGRQVNIKCPKDAVSHGIGYLSEDRKRYGLALGLSVTDNAMLASLDDYASSGFINQRKCEQETYKYIKSIDIKTPSSRQIIRNLSGGNQQKVVIAKWLIKNCDILIFDEPTRGIDIGAKSEIYKLMNDLVNRGRSIIMISSELPELLRMSDRIIVMCEGAKTKELDISEADSEIIMKYATLNDVGGKKHG
ncbi:ribose import ATP-binding protein RbsA [Peptococcaceae bacterium CEB3]|nr:ribose import ATP-binding protein RbsA [Peptococcaceae bacterium CEB3]